MIAAIREFLSNLRFGKVHRSRLLSCIQVLIALVFLVAVATVTLSMVRYARSSAASELVERGAIASSILARTAARAAELPSAADAELALDRVIYDVRAEQGLQYAFVVDGSGHAVAHSQATRKGRPLAADPVRDAAEKKGWSDDGFYYRVVPAVVSARTPARGGWVYEFVRPVSLSSKAKLRYAGGLELHVGFSLPGFWSFARAGMKRAAPALAVAFLLLVLGNYLAGVFVRPLSTLREETAVAARADDDWELEVDANGEIAEIAHNWNRMVENFRTSYEQVVQARRDMEVRNRVMLYEKKRTEAIVDSLGDGVIVIDAYGKISLVNRECETLLGIEREAAWGRAPGDVLNDEAVVGFLTGAGLPKENGRKNPRRAADVEIERPNGVRYLRITRVPITGADGKPGGAIASIRDMTQEKLEESARKEFVSSVTHELRAPLTAIKSYVEMLIDDEAKDPDLQRDFFNTINEEADRLARLIDDMLNMSKIEVGNLVLNKSIVRTRKLIDDAVKGMRSAAKNKSIELTASVPDDLPDVEADKEMVRVVITNLLGNGVKYTPDGGKVLLSAELLTGADAGKSRRTIAVTVEDNGPGIPEDEQGKIFEKFYRGQATADQKVVGNGLGLALAREIATLHGGDIKVASTVGQGSKFTFLLPAAEMARKVS